MSDRIYPRDMHGYGAVGPEVVWPEGASVAVQIVVNYEEGGENCILHGDSASEAFLSEIVGADPWPGLRHWNMESIYEYGARSGFWRLHRLLEDFQVPVTVFGVATALARSPAQVAAMIAADWEIASHGLKWIDYGRFAEEDEWDHMQQAIALHRSVTGERPRGWYTGRCSVNTLALSAREGGFDYVADSYADDIPYWVETEGRWQLVVPYTLDANDMRFATAQGFNSGEQFLAYLKDSLDMLRSEGQAGRPKMMSIGLHCRLAGRPGRALALQRFLDHARSLDDVWFARRIDIAAHWMQHHPQPASSGPDWRSRGARSFSDAFAEVFEHSPWVAEDAARLEAGPAHDTPVGVHSLLCRAFRDARPGKKLDVLLAHPDLAGKLAAQKRLTVSSTAEQSSAGLHSLSEAERRQFLDLNDRYRQKFGFPFIMAVPGHSRHEILAAFERRLENSRDEEFEEACRQVERIAWNRVSALMAQGG